MLYSRLSSASKSSFFLFGPRGTGKSTWLEQHYPNAFRIDLLRSSSYLKYEKRAETLREEVLGLPKKSWIIIDEIQKLPKLLDEVHSLMFDTKDAYSFALTGSSARKLKRENANLLAGRALNRRFFPLLAQELGQDFDLKTTLKFGMLPRIFGLNSDMDRIEFLDAYTETYLKEEIQQEAVVRNLSTFHRFLQVASIANGEILNLSNISRDVGVARSTVQGYFEVFIDTLLGFYLPALKTRAKIKEVAHPKFYWFDLGALRALQGELRAEVPSSLAGKYFETWLINELRAMAHYSQAGGEFYYWRTESGNEVDCIWARGSHRIGFEFKFSKEWKSEYSQGLNTLLTEQKISSGFGVYLGERALKLQNIWVFPFQEFLSKFWKGELA